MVRHTHHTVTANAGFKGLTIAALESRMRLPMQKLIEKYGGKALVAPSMKEVPIADNPKAFQFFEKLEAGHYDLLILLTGVATRTLIQILETRFPKERILKALSEKTKIVVRGPKPKSVCAMNQIPVSVVVPEPNTWREILTILREKNLLSGKKIAVLEYGISNNPFLEELEAEKAKVTPVGVYQWALPDDLGPLNRAIDAILAEKVDLILFTTSVQSDHLLQVVKTRGDELKFRRALAKVGVASIGPATSERLREHQIFSDIEACPNKLETLVEQTAAAAKEIVQKKRERAEKSRGWLEFPKLARERSGGGIAGGGPPPERTRSRASGSTAGGGSEDRTSRSLLMKACRREKNSQVPIWLMRQAGRYMAEYHLSRRGLDFLSFCKNSDYTAEATLTAVERLGVDAAIIFADILLIVEPLGLSLEYRTKEGPVIGNPLRDGEAIRKLKLVDVNDSLSYVMEAVKKVRSSMDKKIPLIGFCGAPYTVASYMIEGVGGGTSTVVKKFAQENPKDFYALMEKITTASIDYVNAQIEAGADLIQIFDSWVGNLTPKEYRDTVFSHSQRLIRGIKQGIPVIHFGTSTEALLTLMKEAGGDVIGIDWQTDIKKAWDELGEVSVQGNLNPKTLFEKPEIIFKEAEKILKVVGSRPGFIFNLGHGILPETPVDHVIALVDFVHDWKIT